MKKTKNRNILSLSAFILILALILSACGGSSGSQSPVAADTSTETTAADALTETTADTLTETAAVSETETQAPPSTESEQEEASSEAIVTEAVDIIGLIKDRGYLIVGCKTDVPGLGLYDSDTKTWSGIEVELAWMTAAKIFDVDLEEAKDEKLVHFEGVTVADREEKLEKGEIDCMIATYTITDERAARFSLSDSYYTDYIGILVKYTGTDENSLGDRGEIRSLAGLDGKYVGIAKNSTTRDDMLNYINTMNTIKPSPIFCVYDSYPDLFKALKEGKIDAISVDVSILGGYVDSETQILPDRFAGQHYGAAVRQGDEALLAYINEAISK